ncbi:MAG: hypothetical protein LBE55_00360 [Clostridiales bacterium]|jgi:hypothetical protein|nr:hypothetical protein [Clostridiales bacterium]
MKKIINAQNFRFLVLACFALSSVYLVAYIFMPQIGPGILTFDDPAILLYYNLSAIFVLLLPDIIKRFSGFAISGAMLVVYVAFVFSGLFLGTTLNFYGIFIYWDLFLHFLSGVLLGILGFAMLDFAQKKMPIKPASAAIFAFCFSMAAGKIWEIYEFGLDSTIGTNTQRWADVYGAPFIGQGALANTMWDMVFNMTGTILIVIWGYGRLRGKGWPQGLKITRAEK